MSQTPSTQGFALEKHAFHKLFRIDRTDSRAWSWLEYLASGHGWPFRSCFREGRCKSSILLIQLRVQDSGGLRFLKLTKN